MGYTTFYKELREEWDKDREYSPPRLERSSIVTFIYSSMEEPEIVQLVKSYYDEQNPPEVKIQMQIEKALFEHAKTYTEGEQGIPMLMLQGIKWPKDPDRQEWVIKIARALQHAYPLMYLALKRDVTQILFGNSSTPDYLPNHPDVIYVAGPVRTQTVQTAPRLTRDDIIKFSQEVLNDKDLMTFLKKHYKGLYDKYMDDDERQEYWFPVTSFTGRYVAGKGKYLVDKQKRDDWPWIWLSPIKRVLDYHGYMLVQKLYEGEIESVDSDKARNMLESSDLVEYVDGVDREG